MSETILVNNIIGVAPIITEDYLGYYSQKFDSLSINNDYVPAYSLVEGTLFSSKRKVLQYNLVYKKARMGQKRKFSDFASHLYYGIRSDWAILSHPSINARRYIAHNGILVNSVLTGNNDVVTPLIMLAVKTRHLFDIKRGEFKPYQFCLLIDKKLSEPEHFTLFRNIKKYYINVAGRVVDVMYCNSIIETVFSNPTNLPKFSTIAEVVEHTKSMNQLILNNL